MTNWLLDLFFKKVKYYNFLIKRIKNTKAIEKLHKLIVFFKYKTALILVSRIIYFHARQNIKIGTFERSITVERTIKAKRTLCGIGKATINTDKEDISIPTVTFRHQRTYGWMDGLYQTLQLLKANTRNTFQKYDT